MDEHDGGPRVVCWGVIRCRCQSPNLSSLSVVMLHSVDMGPRKWGLFTNGAEQSPGVDIFWWQEILEFEAWA